MSGISADQRKKLESHKIELYNVFDVYRYMSYAWFLQICVAFLVGMSPVIAIGMDHLEVNERVIKALVIFILVIGSSSVIVVRETALNIRTIRQINERLGEDTIKELSEKNLLKPVQDVVNLMQLAYIIATMLSALLWFFDPFDPNETNYMEPLTIILGFGTGLYAYFRDQLPKAPLIDISIE